MNKHHIVQQIQSHLLNELASLNLPDLPDAENPQYQRAAQLKHELLTLQFLPIREFNENDIICPSVLTEVEYHGIRSFYLIVPQVGGYVTEIEGKPIQVLTPNSPLGEALLGKKVGDKIYIQTRSGIREYKIISLS